MPELLDFLWDHWWVAAVLFLACYGLGALSAEVPAAFRKWLWGERPKPKPYRVTIQDGEGWPLRSYSLPAASAGRLLQDLERDRDRDNPA
jgi:hypothetical protein